MSNVAIEQEDLQKILDYLLHRPFIEVHEFIRPIMQAQPMQQSPLPPAQEE